MKNPIRALLLVLAAARLALPAVADDPIAWFAMDAVSGGTVADASGNGRALALHGDIALVDDETMGTVLEFPGTRTDYASFTCPALTARTISGWFLRDRDNGDLDGNNPYFYNNVSGSGLNWYRANTPFSFVQSGKTVDGPATSRGVWHHFAVTVSGGDPADITLYVDGVPVATGSESLSWSTAASTAILGNLNASGGRPFKGRMSDFRVYGSSLSASEVAALAAPGLARRGPVLVGRWPFDTVANGTTPDIAGQAADMTVGSGVTTTPGVDGTALRFLSAQNVGASVALPVSLGEHTWAMWVRRSSQGAAINEAAGSGNAYPRLLAAPGYRVQLATLAGNDRRADFITTTGGDSTKTSTAAGVADPDAWCHVALVCHAVEQGGVRKGIADWYVNGVIASSATHNAFDLPSPFLPAGNILLGNLSIGGTRYFCGDIDDLRLYDGALSAAEVKRLHAGLATVSAGADLTVCGTRAMLRGTIGDDAGNGVSTGYAGEASWSLVSAPEGGEGAAIHNPAAAATTVELPVAGAYVFRLTLSDLGASRADEVTVTRVAEPAGNAAPTVAVEVPVGATTAGGASLVATVSDDGLPAPASCRIWWSVKSGPGGVWFAPPDAASTHVSFGAPGDYVLSCTADDGARRTTRNVPVSVTGEIDGSTLATGLGYSWSMDGSDARWTRTLSGAPWSSISQTAGVAGLATAFNGHKPYVSTGVTAFPGEEGGTANTASALPFLTMSAWVYVDPASTNNWFGAEVIGKYQTFGLRYKEKANGTWAEQQQGFTIYQQGAGGSTTLFHYPAPSPAPEGRWLHLCAVVDRSAGTAMEMWYDGVQQTALSSSGGAAGRYNANPVTIGGMPYYTVSAGSTGSTGYNNYNVFYPSTTRNTATVVGQEYSRTFPGIIDEVKIWSRKLSGAEIRYLASHPDFAADRGASVQEPDVPIRIAPRTEIPVAAVAFADTLPTGAALTYRWEEISGRAADVAFADATAASTTATFGKGGAYVLQLTVSDGVRTVHSLPCRVETPSGTVLIVK